MSLKWTACGCSERLPNFNQVLKATNMGLSSFKNSVSALFAGSPWLNLLFLVVGLVSFVASIYFYIASRKDKLPVYVVKVFRLIKNNVGAIENLALRYQDKPIRSLSVGKVALWNRGRETINRVDIANADRLRVALAGNGEVLAAKISFVRRGVNNISLSTESNAVYVEFDFLDNLDGCVLDVYFTGESSLTVRGTIKGASGIKQAQLDSDYLVDRFILPIIEKIPLPQRPFKRKIVAFLVVVVLLPIFLPLAMTGQIIVLFRRVPREYSLSE